MPLHLLCGSATGDLDFMVQNGAIHIPDSKIVKAQRKGNGGHTLSLKEGSGKDHILTHFPLMGFSYLAIKLPSTPAMK